MFDNPGKLIKGWAKAICYVGIAISVIYGIIVLNRYSYEGYNNFENEMVWMGLIIMVGGSIVSWVCALLIYGFGELVENSTEIHHKIKRVVTLLESENTEQKCLAMDEERKIDGESHPDIII
jgi:hypothetical protein